MYGFRHSLQDRLPLTSNVSSVQALVAGNNAAQGDYLGRIGKTAGWINQPGGQAKGPGLQRLNQQPAHGVQFGSGGRPILDTHDGDAKRRVSGQRAHVDAQTAIL